MLANSTASHMKAIAVVPQISGVNRRPDRRSLDLAPAGLSTTDVIVQPPRADRGRPAGRAHLHRLAQPADGPSAQGPRSTAVGHLRAPGDSEGGGGDVHAPTLPRGYNVRSSALMSTFGRPRRM